MRLEIFNFFQIFVAEIAQPHQRGWLSAITVPTIGLGSLLAYSLGALISWHWVAVIAISFPVLLIPGKKNHIYCTKFHN